MEEVVFSVSLKGSGSNMRCARVRPRELMVSPPTRGEAGERGVMPWESASGWEEWKGVLGYIDVDNYCFY